MMMFHAILKIIIAWAIFLSHAIASPDNRVTYTKRKLASKLRSSSISSIIRRPFRDISFWSRAAHIYSSYKVNQIRGKLFKRVKSSTETATKMDIVWERVHEINSRRMMNLCIHLRGFYLKSGQFLGTRHDFMPSQFTVITCYISFQTPLTYH